MSAHDPSDPENPFDLRDSSVEWQRRELEPLLSAIDGKESRFDAEAAWTRVSSRLADQRRARRSRWRGGVLAGVSAAAVLTVMVVYRSADERSPMVFATAPGSVDSVTFEDGTMVVLDGHSRVETDRAFGARTRTVQLRGRAHFRVAHDATRPFRVSAGGMVAEAVGTAFTVAEAGLRDEVEVVVTEGRVAVVPIGNDVAPLVLAAGERATTRPGATVVERLGIAETHTAWMSGERRVAAWPLRRVLPQMNRWFGLSIVVADSALLERRLTVDWRHTSPTRAVTELAAIIDADLQQRGDTITLRARRERRVDVR
jgi:transmembrane sensor